MQQRLRDRAARDQVRRDRERAVMERERERKVGRLADELKRSRSTLRHSQLAPEDARPYLEDLEAIDRRSGSRVEDVDELLSATLDVQRRVSQAVLAADRTIRDHSQRLSKMESMLAQIPREDALRFDREGSESIRELVGRCRLNLVDADLLQELSVEGARHATEVAGRRLAHDRRAAELRMLAGGLDARLGDLAGQADVSVAFQSYLVPVEELSAEVRNALDRGDLEAAASNAEAMSADLGKLEADVEQWTQQLRERTIIVGALRDGLGELGFAINADSHVEDAQGAVGFRAEHVSGWELALTVGADQGEEQIQYMVSRSMRQEQEGPKGEVVKRCDSAADAIEAVHEGLRGRGIDVGRLTWDGMPPDYNAEKTRPRGGDQERRQS